MRTLGHSKNQGGLRGHSVGHTYPISVSYKGTPAKGVWYVWNLLTGEIFKEFKGSLEAHRYASSI